MYSDRSSLLTYLNSEVRLIKYCVFTQKSTLYSCCYYHYNNMFVSYNNNKKKKKENKTTNM